MTNDEILQAAKEVGYDWVFPSMPIDKLERFAAIIEKRTIERCALAAIEACTSDLTDAEVIAAIRKLGEQE